MYDDPAAGEADFQWIRDQAKATWPFATGSACVNKAWNEWRVPPSGGAGARQGPRAPQAHFVDAGVVVGLGLVIPGSRCSVTGGKH